jgi:PAP2 superfamily
MGKNVGIISSRRNNIQSTNYIIRKNIKEILSNILNFESALFGVSLFLCLGAIVTKLAGWQEHPVSLFSPWGLSGMAAVIPIVLGSLFRFTVRTKYIVGISALGLAFTLWYSLFWDGNYLSKSIWTRAIMTTTVFSSLAALFLSAVTSKDTSAFKMKLRAAQLAFSIVILTSSIQWLIYFMSMNILTDSYDFSVFTLENALGPRIPAILRLIANEHRRLSTVILMVYGSTPVAFVIYDFCYLQSSKWPMTKMIIGSTVIGSILYSVAPVVGTSFFLNYNDLNLSPAKHEPGWTTMGLPKNAMPSLHATWGLLLIFAVINDYKIKVQRWSLVESGFLIFGILTILGALIHGDHYLLDAVVAIPLAAGLYSLMYSKTNFAIPGLVLTASHACLPRYRTSLGRRRHFRIGSKAAVEARPAGCPVCPKSRPSGNYTGGSNGPTAVMMML